MKIILLSLLSYLALKAQVKDNFNLGKDDNPVLTKSEISYFSQLNKLNIDTFKFEGKRIAFFTGSGGSMLISKSEYFEDCVIPWLEKDSHPQTFVRVLTEQERKQTKFDAFVFSWVKIYTPKQHKKNINRLKQIKASS